MNLVLIAVVVLPMVSALVAVLLGERRGAAAGRVGAAVMGVEVAAVVMIAVAVVRGGQVSATLAVANGTVLAGLYADRVGAVLLLLVCGVSAVVQSFARRYLHGDRRAAWFFAATGLLTSATVAMVTAVTLIGFAIAWTIAGGALCLLLGMYSTLPAAREGVRRTVRAFAIGDGALWLAVALATTRWGNIDLHLLGEQMPRMGADQGVMKLVAGLLVVAALARSAQLPFQRWLPATLAAPTPVSALLHAGVVNAGGVLLARLGPLFADSTLAMHLVFVAGAATAVYGTVLMVAKPDVKGALAHSTMGQMGFMFMTFGLGAFAAAVFHLVAHGMYKATLFLGAGAAVHRQVRHGATPPAHRLRGGRLVAAVAFSLAVPAGALISAVALLPPHAPGTGSGALLIFAWASGARASWGWLRRGPTPAAAFAALVAVALTEVVYVRLLHVATGFLASTLVPPGQVVVSPWLLAVVVIVMLALALLQATPWPGLFGELHRNMYVFALNAGHVAASRSAPSLSGVRRRLGMR